MPEIDAEQLRNAVSSRLFGVAAEPVKIGRFTVLRRIGAGGMGVVYSAYDNQLDRKVAIKLLHGTQKNEDRQARLLREAQALARLSHPNVVQVYEVGTFRGQVFVAMEFVHGTTLRQYLENDSHTRPDILHKFLQAGRGLAAAHAAGLVHRDFKPDNVLVSEDGRTLVVDFGLARASDTSGGREQGDPQRDPAEATPLAAQEDPLAGDSLNCHLTRTGALLGTPAYMAPEQHRGAPADARSDQFSFCVALWEALCGERPFEGANALELAVRVNSGTTRSSSRSRALPARIRRPLLKGLGVERDQRYPDMEMLLTALFRRQDRRRLAWISATVSSLVALGLLGWMWTRPALDVCNSGAHKLVGVWDQRVQGALRDVFLATGAPFAQDAWATTATTLGAYAQRWEEMHGDACEAAMLRSEQSPELFGRRMVCLGQRLTALE